MYILGTVFPTLIQGLVSIFSILVGSTGIKWVGWGKMGNVDCWKTVDQELINQHSLYQGGSPSSSR